VRLALASAAAALALAGCSAVAAGDPAGGGLPPGSPHAGEYRLTVGVDLYVDRDYPLSQVRAWGERDIAYLANVLHVANVGIDWDFVLPSPHADQVEPASFVTPPPADVRALTDIAKAHGMTVTYRVLFWLDGPTAPLAPDHPDAFFASLLAAERPYLALAQAEGVPEFVTGTERTTLAASPRWGWLLGRAAETYDGTLSYAQWGGEPGDGGFFYGDGYLMPVGEYGVTTYPNTDLAATATTAQLTGAWEAYLSRVPGPVLERTAIDEVGIPAEDGEYSHPWDWPGRGAPDDEIQARWFAAACAAAAAERMRGIWFWNAAIEDDPAEPPTSAVSFEGRPTAEAAIRACAERGD
jgi:hypothetical protein